MSEKIGVLVELFRNHVGKEPVSVNCLPFSGSNRRYYRIKTDEVSYIGVIGEDADENRTFIYMSDHFKSKGINVPEVVCADKEMSVYLQEDLGADVLFDIVSEGRLSGNYSEEEKKLLINTVEGLAQLQCAGAEGMDFDRCYPIKEFGREMVMFDLNYFKYCFLKNAGIEFDQVRLQYDFERLADEISASESDVFMYRDFQSRNVIVKDGVPFYIDFQGGMKGPVYYDVASFVWQARARYPQSLRQEMVDAYLNALSRYRNVDRADFMTKLRLFVLVRTLQVLGAYGFRGYYERKGHFLKSIPPAVENIRELLDNPYEDYPYLNQVLGKIVTLYDNGCLKGVRPVAVCMDGASPLVVTVSSFSYKKGIPEDMSGNGGGYVFDCRAIHNPGKYDQYKSLTGRDEAVKRFLEDDGEVLYFLDNAYSMVDAHVNRFLYRGFTSLTVSFGCTGGQHRSVYCAEHMAMHLASVGGVKVHLVHREQGIDEWL